LIERLTLPARNAFLKGRAEPAAGANATVPAGYTNAKAFSYNFILHDLALCQVTSAKQISLPAGVLQIAQESPGDALKENATAQLKSTERVEGERDEARKRKLNQTQASVGGHGRL
jgi:hypothetical protein